MKSKTNIEKQKRKTKRKPRVLLFEDPIFMHHMLACVHRYLELALPEETRKFDTEFRIFGKDLIAPKGMGEREGDKR